MNFTKEDMQKFKDLLNFIFLICVISGFNIPFILSTTIIEQLNISQFNKITSYSFIIITMCFAMSLAVKFKNHIKII